MRDIKLDYVGCNTARENLRATSNTWLTKLDRDKIKNAVDNFTDEECEKLKIELEKDITERARACLAWY